MCVSDWEDLGGTGWSIVVPHSGLSLTGRIWEVQVGVLSYHTVCVSDWEDLGGTGWSIVIPRSGL